MINYGVFKYSKEDGTPAATFKDQIHWKTKEKRWNIIMKIQQEISKNKLKEKLGKTYEAIIDEITDDGKYAIARTYMDVPDMDGVLWIKNDGKLEKGQIVNSKITDVLEYDLKGEIVK